MSNIPVASCTAAFLHSDEPAQMRDNAVLESQVFSRSLLACWLTRKQDWESFELHSL